MVLISISRNVQIQKYILKGSHYAKWIYNVERTYSILVISKLFINANILQVLFR